MMVGDEKQEKKNLNGELKMALLKLKKQKIKLAVGVYTIKYI